MSGKLYASSHLPVIQRQLFWVIMLKSGNLALRNARENIMRNYL